MTLLNAIARTLLTLPTAYAEARSVGKRWETLVIVAIHEARSRARQARQRVGQSWQATAPARRAIAIYARATYVGTRVAAPHIGRALVTLAAAIYAVAVMAYRRGQEFAAWIDIFVEQCEAPALIEPISVEGAIAAPEVAPVAIAPAPILTPAPKQGKEVQPKGGRSSRRRNTPALA